MSFFRQSVLAVVLCACFAAAQFGEEDIKYSQLPGGNVPTDNKIAGDPMEVTVQYPEGISCDEEDPDARGEECAEVSWDDDDWVFVSWTLPTKTLNDLTVTGAQAYRCFSGFSKQNRAWRKYKDVIRKDKQCKKIGKFIPADQPQEFNYTIPSDSAEATYFFRVMVKCGDGKHDFCAKGDNFGKYYAVKPMDSIPGGLIAGVVIAVIIAPTFLVLYFVYEFGLKKEK